MSSKDLHLDNPVDASTLNDNESKLGFNLQQLHAWWKKLKDSKYKYNIFQELRKYRSNDAWLLYVSLMKFRTDFIKQTATS